ncbi:MAG: D-alanine--D-alanine ligase [Actinobacteria bacterium]|nr:D-alanine--D-alanine ligase [Actinomycetota bacterium]
MGCSPSPPARARLVVLFGGRSAEHDVSCVSAASVLGALDPARYEIRPVGITLDGRWVAAEPGEEMVAAGTPLDPLAAVKGPTTVVLPLLHGPFGEDGTIQGLLEQIGVPYVGSGVLASALCMDKALAKQVLDQAGLPQPRHLVRRDVRRDGNADDAFVEHVGDQLGWPVFVKPANLGSSVGISRVDGPHGLAEALALAAAYDEWLVIEEAIVGREIECGVLGDVILEASVPGEILPSAEFYDFDDKYADSGAELVVPARLADDVSREVQRLAVAAAVALRVEGMARVDFFYEEAARGLLVNEVNTIPGFTPRSMYPRLWAATGLAYPDLIDRLVALALERHARRAGRIGRPRR